MNTLVLFDSTSVGPEGLSYFEIQKQVTVTALGMADGEYITFEMATISSPPRSEACGPCDMPEVVMPQATSWQPLMCCGTCEGYTGPVRLSSRNPVVILDAPTNTRIRAVYNGHDFSLALPFSAVVSLRESNVSQVADGLRGCCPPKCECEDLAISANATGETSVQVDITGCPTVVTTRLFNGATEYHVTGTSPIVFTGLTPNTTYSVEVTGDCCGDSQAVQVKTNAPPVCPPIGISVTSDTPDSLTVQITSGGSATVTVGAEPEQYGPGPFVFSGLTQNTSYTVKAINDCGNKTTTTAKTLSCPAIAVEQVSNTTGSVTVLLVSGGPATVSLGAVSSTLDDGGTKTFMGLSADTEYSVLVESACGTELLFETHTAVCPDVAFSISNVSVSSFTVDVPLTDSVDLYVRTLGDQILDTAVSVSGSYTFSGLPAGATVYVEAVNECDKARILNVNLLNPDRPFCASYWLANDEIPFNGYAYTAGDYTDPAATVAYGDLFLYPTAGEGHTVKVTDVNGATIGYAANKSDCAGCCVLIPRPIPEADLSLVKSSTPPSPAVGDMVSWTVTATNSGPSDAPGSVLSDSPPQGLTFSVVGYVYSGGATGPATSTMAELIAGVEVDLPLGATVTAIYSAVLPAGMEGQVLLNSASIIPASGVYDPVQTNNTAIHTIVVAQPCYLKCDDELLRFSSGAAGAGVCIAWGGVSYNPFRGRAVFRMRDATWEEGGGTQTGNPGAYLTLNITNPYPEPAMLRVDGFTANNGFSGANGATNVRVGFVTKIGEVLGINMPNAYDLYADPSEIRDILDMSVSTAAGGGDSGENYGEVTGYGYYKRLLQPGQTVTVYMQSWVILSQQYPFLGSTVHAHMNAAWELHRNAAQV